MHFDKALWDGSDPHYTPCSSWSGKWLYWKAPKKYRDRGYAIKQYRLPGVRDDGQEAARAQRARELTREMLAWYKGDAPNVTVGSVKWLVARYLSDTFSPFQELKASSTPKYRFQMKYWENSTGECLLKSINYERLMTWKKAMETNGRSVDFISRAFTHFRILINYGVVIEEPDCIRLSEILTKTRIKSPKPKSVAPTPAQVEGVITAAERGGEAMFALGIQLQWWYRLRPVDVRGQYLLIKNEEDRSGIMKGNKRWVDGLDWSMFDKDLTFFEKVQSKTEQHGVGVLEFDLTLVPEVREKLIATPIDRRVGPVIVNPSSGFPYSADDWSRLWRKFAAQAGVPFEVKVMDTRAGAISHGSSKGATRTQLKGAAGHSNENTTERYMRTRDTDYSKVIQLRRNGES